MVGARDGSWLWEVIQVGGRLMFERFSRPEFDLKCFVYLPLRISEIYLISPKA
jgi:hypothetical protein